MARSSGADSSLHNLVNDDRSTDVGPLFGVMRRRDAGR